MLHSEIFRSLLLLILILGKGTVYSKATNVEKAEATWMSVEVWILLFLDQYLHWSLFKLPHMFLTEVSRIDVWICHEVIKLISFWS